MKLCIDNSKIIKTEFTEFAVALSPHFVRVTDNGAIRSNTTVSRSSNGTLESAQFSTSMTGLYVFVKTLKLIGQTDDT